MKAVPLEKIDRKTGKVIGVRWRFEEYNPEKRRNEPVRKALIPEYIRNCQNPSEVEAFVRSWNAKNESLRHRAEMLKQWREKYHDFTQYLAQFETFQRERAPNSYKNDLFYLEQYAFGFFLTHSSLNNLNEWALFFDEFRSWLKTVQPMKYTKKNLSLNTQIKIIKALNRFLEFSFQKRWIEKQPKCPSYGREDTMTVTAEDVFRDEEIPIVADALRALRPDSADLFIVLIHTGLRENEALGLCIDFVSQGKIDGPKSKKIHAVLERYDLARYHGYLCLESQPALKSIRAKTEFTDRWGVKWPKGSVPRKPLKHRKKIAPKWYRFIPVFDKEAWNILVDRTNAAMDLIKIGTYGRESRDYLLFPSLTASMFYYDLALALKQLKLRHRSPHKTRHSFFTKFYDWVSEDMFLADCVGGHRDQRDVERYCHVREQIGRERAEQMKRTGRLVRV